jgi:myo-inositol 2-dehydrogenase / D-chiro-inositol 1-dehydrogenase
MSADFRLGLVGCGRVASLGYLPAIARARGVRLAAVADPVVARCRDLAPHVAAFPDARSMIAAGIVDAIVLATPAATHLIDARYAAAAGLPALVEKPPALSAEDARALCALIPRPWVGFNRRFDPLLQRLRARVPATGSLTLSIDLHYAQGSWRPYTVEDDALLSVGTHLIDLVRWLTGSDVQRVRTRFLSTSRAVTELEFDRGTAYVSCATDQPPRDWIVVSDSMGRIIAQHNGVGGLSKASALWALMRDARLRRLIRPASRTALVRLLIQELEAFAAAIGSGQRRPPDTQPPILASAVDGLAVMAVVDAARRSALEDGSWQSLAVGMQDAEPLVVTRSH